MADETIKALAVQVALDDGSFQAGMKSLQRTVTEADSSFKASIAGIKDWGNNLDSLKANSERLSTNIATQNTVISKYNEQLGKLKDALSQSSQKMTENKTKLDAAKAAYEQSSTSIGKNADETQKLKKQLDAAQKAYDSSEGLVRKNNKAVQDSTIQYNNAKGKLNEMNAALKENDAQIQKVEKSQSLLGKASDKLGVNMQSVKASIGAVGIAVGGFLESSIKDAKEAGNAQANLEQTVKSTGGAAGLSAKQMEELAEKEMGLSTYSKDDIESGEAMLATFTQIGKNVFPQATQAVLDFSQKMGTEPKAAALTLGKALNDPAAGLSKLTKAGVTFTAVQQNQIKAMEKAGNTAGAQKLMIAELEKEFGGQASAATTTFAGKQKQLSNQLKEVKESIGNALIPILSQLGGYLVKILQPIAQFVSQNPKLATGILAVIAVVGTLVGGLTAVSTVASALNIKLTVGMLPTMGLVIVAVAAVAAAAILIVKNWGPISAFFTNLWNQILNATKPIWQAIEKAITDAWNVIGPTIKSGLQAVQSFWNNVWPQIQQVFSVVWTAIKVILAPIIAWMYIVIKTDLALIQSLWNTVWTLIKDTFKTVWDLIVGIVKTAWALISGVIKTDLDLITGIFKIFKDLFTGNWGALWNDVKSLFGNIWNDISGIFKGVTGNIGDIFKNLATDALQWGGDLINGFVNGIKSAVGGLVDAVKNVANTVKSYLHFSRPDIGPLMDYETWMPDMMAGLANGITANKYKVQNAIRSLSSDISVGVKSSISAQPAAGTASTAQTVKSAIQGGSVIIYEKFEGKASTPAENTRQQKNMLRRLALQLN